MVLFPDLGMDMEFILHCVQSCALVKDQNLTH